jgi:hypothetical protein
MHGNMPQTSCFALRQIFSSSGFAGFSSRRQSLRQRLGRANSVPPESRYDLPPGVRSGGPRRRMPSRDDEVDRGQRASVFGIADFLLLEFDLGEAVVLEDDDLHGKLVVDGGRKFRHANLPSPTTATDGRSG